MFKPGDIILSVNGMSLHNKEDLITAIQSNDVLNIKMKRNNKITDVVFNPVKTIDGKNKIGLWVRDSTQGIGTITYFNPESNKFGALGHGIADVDTKQLMSVKSGEIKKTNVVSIIKGASGNPGELIGDLSNSSEAIGNVRLNSEFGLYGYLNKILMPNQKLQIATRDQVHTGNAYIRSDIDGSIQNYSIVIDSVNKFSSDAKNMIIRITDKRLIDKTNGIVQGMSGSPIIQDNRLIGAVTHVFVHEPTKGYGIFIDNMLNQEDLI